MPLRIHGSNGISGLDGTASAPAVKGTDTDTGLFFGNNTASIAAGGNERVVVDANGLDLNGNFVTNVVAMAADDIDCSAGNYFTKTINGNTTFTISNVPTSRAFAFVLELTHTSGTVTWPTSVKFPAATPPPLTAGKTHLFVLVSDDNGATFRTNAVADFDN